MDLSKDGLEHRDVLERAVGENGLVRARRFGDSAPDTLDQLSIASALPGALELSRIRIDAGVDGLGEEKVRKETIAAPKVQHGAPKRDLPEDAPFQVSLERQSQRGAAHVVQEKVGAERECRAT